MDFYNVREQTTAHHGPIVLDHFDNFFADSMLDSVFDDSIYNMGHLNYPENGRPPTQNVTYTEVFRASDMNTAELCVNGVQHLSSSPSSTPITPDGSHDDNADIDSDCTSCIKCRESATQKRARRREQNRQSQRKFRAKKEAKLSDAKARIRDLEALVKAQEKTNVELKLTIEELNSQQTRMHTNARRHAMLNATKRTPAFSSEMTNCWNGSTNSDHDSSGSLAVMRCDHELSPSQESKKKK